MDSIIVIEKEVYSKLIEYYDRSGKIKYKKYPLFKILEEEFIKSSGKIISKTSEDAIELYSDNLKLLGNYDRSEGRINIRKCIEMSFEHLTDTYMGAKYLTGPFVFLTEDEAQMIKRQSNEYTLVDGSKECDSEAGLDQSISSIIPKSFTRLKDYESYWNDIDILKKYEMQEYEEKLVKSVHQYEKIDIKINEVTFTVEENDYVFRKDDYIYICSKSQYEKNANNLSSMNSMFVGQFVRYKNERKKIVTKSDSKTIRLILENEELKKGYLYSKDIGFLAKQSKEKAALRNLFHFNTPNHRMRRFFPDIHEADPTHKKINMEYLSSDFNNLEENQKQAVEGALKAKDIYLIQGPPGTGKTTVICEMIKYLTRDGKRVLLSAQTHLAVDNVLQRIGESEGVKAVRIGREERFELGSEKYALDNCAANIQLKMIRENQRKFDECNDILVDSNYREEILYLHEKMKKHINLLIFLEQELLTLNDEKENAERELDSISSEMSLARKKITDIDFMKKGKENVFKIIRTIAEKLGYSNEQLIMKVMIYEATRTFTYERAALRQYAELFRELNERKMIEERLAQKFHTLESEKAKIIRNLSIINESRKEYYKAYLLDSSNEKMFLDLTQQYNKVQNEFFDKERLLTDTRDELNKVKGESDTAFRTLQTLDMLIGPGLNVQKESLKATLGTQFLSKIRHIGLIEDSDDFRAMFPMEEDDFMLIKRIEEFEHVSLEIEKISELESSVSIWKDKITDLTNQIDGLKAEKTNILETAFFKQYCEMYQVAYEEMKYEVEMERCEDFIEDYHQKRKKIHLLQSTTDIRQEWMKVLSSPHQCFRDYYIRGANLICATCLGIASSSENEFEETVFDYVIIDEAARATSSELLVPLVRGKTMVLVGDHEQINPEIERSLMERIEREELKDRKELDELYNGSLFGKIYKHAPDEMKTFLNRQHRMHTSISRIVSSHFYDNKLLDGERVYEKRHGIKKLNGNSVIFVTTPNNKIYEDVNDNTSYINIGEAGIILSILSRLDDEMDETKTVGIITPYKSQEQYLKSQITGMYKHLNVEVNTIDGFQGREAEVIILSLVRNNPQGRVGHIGEKSRLNVAFSRAQELLIVVGNIGFFKKSYRAKKVYDIIRELEKGGKVYDAAYFN